jgi:hypothetical protein
MAPRTPTTAPGSILVLPLSRSGRTSRHWLISRVRASQWILSEPWFKVASFPT